ncbi:MAG: hypothetical protein OXR68_07930 [Alphaproteobacteria bacterium]|nr:hypothetical protein [Alphaproteobacteria bacterium]MDD9920533.1 hypothetical protein [Alphaproteobacteria bacterium]
MIKTLILTACFILTFSVHSYAQTTVAVDREVELTTGQSSSRFNDLLSNIDILVSRSKASVDALKAKLDMLEFCNNAGQILLNGACVHPQRAVVENDPQIGTLQNGRMCRAEPGPYSTRLNCDVPSTGGGNNCHWRTGVETGNHHSQSQIECPVGSVIQAVSVYNVHNCNRIGGRWECNYMAIKCCQ